MPCSSRRSTFRAAPSCRGAGVTLALPLLDAMVPAHTALAQTAASAEAPFHGDLLPARDGARAMGTRRRRRPAAEAAVHPRVAGEGEGPDGRAERPVVEVGGAARGHDRFGPLGGGSVSHRHQAAQDRRIRRHGGQPDDRSAHRAENRSRDAAALAPAGGGGSELRARATAERATAVPTRTPSRGLACRRRLESVLRTSPLPMELNPQVVFERLFGSGATPERRAARMAQTRRAFSTRCSTSSTA